MHSTVAAASDGDVVDADYEYAPFRLPPGTDRVTAAVHLTLQAEFGGWELARLQLHADGTRKVMLRRRRSRHRLPPPLL
jgi:hypothetical protein